MRWGKRDQQMAARRVSPGVKVGIFLGVILLVGVIVFGGWMLLKSFGGSEGSDSPLTAGESFTPGAVEELYGTETEAVLDGLEQKVRANNPSDEWKNSLENVTCSEATCTASAPGTIDSSSDDEGGGLLGFIPGFSGGGFLGTGLSLGVLIGALFLTWMLYSMINEE